LKEELCSRFSVTREGVQETGGALEAQGLLKREGAGEQKASRFSSPGGYVKAAESADSADL